MAEQKVMTIDNVDRQRQYIEKQKSKGQGLGVVFADAFLRGMRDLGYKNPAWAMSEQLDNSFQAGATTVAIRFGFGLENKTKVKPDHVAICDNGNGMIPEMISYAVRWGGTDREGDRTGFGRYGYGLPSSAVSIAKRYTVYSKVKGEKWHAVTVDIDELAAASGDLDETQRLLAAKPSELPRWVLKGGKQADTLDVAALESGTVVVLDDIDRLRTLGGWIKVDTLRTKLLQHFGVIYRHWIPQRRIFVDGVETQAVDPLFLMEHARFFDENSVHAKRVEARKFEVETPRGTKGTVTIRASVLPPNFQYVDPAEYPKKGAKLNTRHEIMRDFNGLVICRERRQVDTIQPRWTKFQNNDANIKVEIDFDPELDEFFGITTAKQQVVIDDDLWEKLKHSGQGGGDLQGLVQDLREEYEKLQKELKAQAESKAGSNSTQRPSASAMQDTEQYKATVPEPTEAQKEEGQRNLENAAAAQAAATGQPKEQVLQELTDATKKRRFEVEFLAVPEGPFYRPVRLGEQKRLIINTDHPFYSKIYDAAPEVRAALEVLLLVLAERELESKKEASTFYKAERQLWSERLRYALDSLVPNDSLVNKASSVAEFMHMDMSASDSSDA